MPLGIYFGFLRRLRLESRDYGVLKTAVIESSLGDFTVEILCAEQDGVLLLDRAEKFFPDAVSYIQRGARFWLRTPRQIARCHIFGRLISLFQRRYNQCPFSYGHRLPQE